MSSNRSTAGGMHDRQESSTPTPAVRTIPLLIEGTECVKAAKYKEALEMYTQAIEILPDPLWYSRRSDLYYMIRRFDEALNDCRTALELDSKCAFAYSQLGLIFKDQKRFDDAIVNIKKAVELDPDYQIFKDDLAHAMQEKLKAAKQESFPPTPEAIAKANALKEEGNEYMKSFKFKEAINKYMEAIALKNDPVFSCNLAAALCRVNDYFNALLHCADAILLDDKYAKAHGRMGFIYSCLNFYNYSAESYKKALELDPTNENYKENLALAEEKVREEAIQQP